MTFYWEDIKKMFVHFKSGNSDRKKNDSITVLIDE